MIQIEFYLPPPITAADAASILGQLGGQARAKQLREPIRETARQMRAELNLPPDPRLA